MSFWEFQGNKESLDYETLQEIKPLNHMYFYLERLLY